MGFFLCVWPKQTVEASVSSAEEKEVLKWSKSILDNILR